MPLAGKARLWPEARALVFFTILDAALRVNKLSPPKCAQSERVNLAARTLIDGPQAEVIDICCIVVKLPIVRSVPNL